MEHMHVELRHEEYNKGHFSVNISEQPPKVRVEPYGDEILLEWNSTIDDSGRLRGCIACGSEVYRERKFPQITGVVVVLAFAGAMASILGLVTTWPMLIAMAVVLALDVAILLLGQPRLVCYKCQTKYSKLDIAPYHQRWDPDRNSQLHRSA